MPTFVQLGATRDGLDPYLHAAHTRGMEAVLIETADYIQWREALKRLEFDWTIAVEHPADVDEVLEAVKRLPERPTLLLAGFERYSYCAYAVVRRLGILPYREGEDFLPPNKAEQRTAISHKTAALLQPRYTVLAHHDTLGEDLVNLSYPLVVKPVDGGGGLGVFLVHTLGELKAALAELSTITNYDGGVFGGTLIEEYVPGTEYSVQGLARNGTSNILTFCKKNIVKEPAKGQQSVYGFRESGHIAIRGNDVDDVTKQFAQTCIDAMDYKNGPFHIDMMQTSQGYYYLEMGFRLSGGGLTKLVQRVSGCNWAAETFAAHLDACSGQLLQPSAHVRAGQITAISIAEIQVASELQAQGHDVEIQLFHASATSLNSASLASDLARHTGFLGRITVSASTVDDVERLLHECSPQRAVPSECPVQFRDK